MSTQKCACTTKEGKACKNNAKPGSKFCGVHAACKTVPVVAASPPRKVVTTKVVKKTTSKKETSPPKKTIVAVATKTLCQCKTKDGKACKKSAVAGSKYCSVHANCGQTVVAAKPKVVKKVEAKESPKKKSSPPKKPAKKKRTPVKSKKSAAVSSTKAIPTGYDFFRQGKMVFRGYKKVVSPGGVQRYGSWTSSTVKGLWMTIYDNGDVFLRNNVSGFGAQYDTKAEDILVIHIRKDHSDGQGGRIYRKGRAGYDTISTFSPKDEMELAKTGIVGDYKDVLAMVYQTVHLVTGRPYEEVVEHVKKSKQLKDLTKESPKTGKKPKRGKASPLKKMSPKQPSNTPTAKSFFKGEKFDARQALLGSFVLQGREGSKILIDEDGRTIIIGSITIFGSADESEVSVERMRGGKSYKIGLPPFVPDIEDLRKEFKQRGVEHWLDRDTSRAKILSDIVAITEDAKPLGSKKKSPSPKKVSSSPKITAAAFFKGETFTDMNDLGDAIVYTSNIGSRVIITISKSRRSILLAENKLGDEISVRLREDGSVMAESIKDARLYQFGLPVFNPKNPLINDFRAEFRKRGVEYWLDSGTSKAQIASDIVAITDGVELSQKKKSPSPKKAAAKKTSTKPKRAEKASPLKKTSPKQKSPPKSSPKEKSLIKVSDFFRGETFITKKEKYSVKYIGDKGTTAEQNNRTDRWSINLTSMIITDMVGGKLRVHTTDDESVTIDLPPTLSTPASSIAIFLPEFKRRGVAHWLDPKQKNVDGEFRSITDKLEGKDFFRGETFTTSTKPKVDKIVDNAYGHPYRSDLLEHTTNPKYFLGSNGSVIIVRELDLSPRPNVIASIEVLLMPEAEYIVVDYQARYAEVVFPVPEERFDEVADNLFNAVSKAVPKGSIATKTMVKSMVAEKKSSPKAKQQANLGDMFFKGETFTATQEGNVTTYRGDKKSKVIVYASGSRAIVIGSIHIRSVPGEDVEATWIGPPTREIDLPPQGVLFVDLFMPEFEKRGVAHWLKIHGSKRDEVADEIEREFITLTDYVMPQSKSPEGNVAAQRKPTQLLRSGTIDGELFTEYSLLKLDRMMADMDITPRSATRFGKTNVVGFLSPNESILLIEHTHDKRLVSVEVWKSTQEHIVVDYVDRYIKIDDDVKSDKFDVVSKRLYDDEFASFLEEAMPDVIPFKSAAQKKSSPPKTKSPPKQKSPPKKTLGEAFFRGEKIERIGNDIFQSESITIVLDGPRVTVQLREEDSVTQLATIVVEKRVRVRFVPDEGKELESFFVPPPTDPIVPHIRSILKKRGVEHWLSISTRADAVYADVQKIVEYAKSKGRATF